ncbi:MAG: hypothetical protein LBV79_06060 [Candidatus Adiutrix sp.]|jgi:hypothetical protein|nr:hypothetical protein [Candidatus Adiutrix sp.]
MSIFKKSAMSKFSALSFVVGASMLAFFFARDIAQGTLTFFGSLPMLIFILLCIFCSPINSKRVAWADVLNETTNGTEAEFDRPLVNPAPPRPLTNRWADWDVEGEKVIALSVPDDNRLLVVRFQGKKWIAELFWNEKAPVAVGDTLLVICRIMNFTDDREITPLNSLLTVVVSGDSYYSLPSQAR